jgi:hypothetical protein
VCILVLLLHVLLAVPNQQRQVQDQREPVSIDEEEDSQETMYGSFGDDVGVEAVTEIDRVDVVAVAELACACQNVFLDPTRRNSRHVGGLEARGELTIPSRCT